MGVVVGVEVGVWDCGSTAAVGGGRGVRVNSDSAALDERTVHGRGAGQACSREKRWQLQRQRGCTCVVWSDDWAHVCRPCQSGVVECLRVCVCVCAYGVCVCL